MDSFPDACLKVESKGMRCETVLFKMRQRETLDGVLSGEDQPGWDTALGSPTQSDVSKGSKSAHEGQQMRGSKERGLKRSKKMVSPTRGWALHFVNWTPVLCLAL